MTQRPIIYHRSEITGLNYGAYYLYPEFTPEELIAIMSHMYDFIYMAGELVKNMICPDRYIDIIVSAEQPDHIDGVSYTNTIIIYPLLVLQLQPCNLWFSDLLLTICHEIYHCVLLQDNVKYSTDDEYNSIVEKQTDYMAFKFIQENRFILESKLGVSIDLVGILKVNFGDNDHYKRVVPFFKHMDGIEYMSMRDVWLDCITAGNPKGLYPDFIENFDKSNNIDIKVFYILGDDVYSIPDGYMIEDTIKVNGIFEVPCRDFMDIRLFRKGTLNTSWTDTIPKLTVYHNEEGDHMHIIVIYHVEKRVPFFKKPV